MTQRDLARVVSDYVTQQVMSQGVPIIDTVAADNGASHTQDEWIAYFNAQRNPSKRMIDAADIYRASDAVLLSFREDCNRSSVVALPRFRYNPDDLMARVIHNFGSTIVKPKKRRIVIPFYKGVPLPEVLKEEQGVLHLQTYFDTKDNKTVMAERLEHIADTKRNDILVYTPSQRSRKNYPERSAGFGYYYHRFHVDGYGNFVNDGLSRGVSVSPRSGRASKR